MKKARLILSVSALAFASMTMVSCNDSDDETCAVGMEGKNCNTEVRDSYVGEYKGNGIDNDGDTYTGWFLSVSKNGTAATGLGIILKDENTAPFEAFTATLTTNTMYNLTEKTSGAYTYTGSGTINSQTATLSLRQAESGSTSVVTLNFTNMIKQ